MAVDMKDTLGRIGREWGAIGLKCDCPEGAACSICEITHLIGEALPDEAADDEAQLEPSATALDIERRVAVSLAVGRFLRTQDRFQVASTEYSGACKNLRKQLGESQRYIVQVDHKHYLVTSDKDGNFEVDHVEAI